MNGIDPESGLTLRGSQRTHRRIVIGHHFILHGYGHWLPNDPRGSGSQEVRQQKLQDLGHAHFGRKKIQPPRSELKSFMRAVEPRLEHPIIWFDQKMRQSIGESLARIVSNRGYTAWACAVLKNHAHLCVRRHRDGGRTIWEAFANSTREFLTESCAALSEHPVWSDRPYTVFLYAPADVDRVIRYINANPEKEGLSPQAWPFVTKYDGWPSGRSPRRAKE